MSEPDTRVLTREGYDSIQRPYNEMIDVAARVPDLEALVLIHQDVELIDDSLFARIRSALRDPTVGIVGPFGWRHPDAHPPYSLGFRLGPASRVGPAGRWGCGYSEGSHEVELIDGVIMVLAPWVLRSIRYDIRLARRFHCYDLDLSIRVRAAGGRLICDPIPHIHHQVRLWRDRDEYLEARMDLASMWDPDLRPIEWAPALRVV